MSEPHQHQLYVAGVTHQGMVRKLNEDSICIDNTLKLFVVADGMGGHGGGDVASREALEALKHALETNNLVRVFQDKAIDNPTLHPDLPTQEACGFDGGATSPAFESLVAKPKHAQAEFDGDSTDPDFFGSSNQLAIQTMTMAIRYANEKVFAINKNQTPKSERNMGTTVAGIWFYSGNEFAVIFHVGDSRVYRYRGGKMIQLTLDHSLYEKWKSEGMKGQCPKKNIITRAVGPLQNVNPNIDAQRVILGDILLICSDGLTGMVSDSVIEAVISSADPKHLETSCQELIDLANQQGGKDNVSAILVAYA